MIKGYNEIILPIVRQAKNDVIRSQRYEEAAWLRDYERIIEDKKVSIYEASNWAEDTVNRYPNLEQYLSELLLLKRRREKLDQLLNGDK